MKANLLNELEKQAAASNLLLRMQIRRPLRLWTIKLVVARQTSLEKVQILGELKGWVMPTEAGLNLDTMQVREGAPACIGHLLWASIMAWSVDQTPCKRARLLAIYDDEKQHQIIIRYFRKRGFSVVKEVGSSVFDLPLRTIWGGAGSLMVANCGEVYQRSRQLWEEYYFSSN